MNFLRDKYFLNDLFISFDKLNKEDFEKSFNYVIDNISQINIIENNISKKIIEMAKTMHSDIVKSIITNKENYEG